MGNSGVVYPIPNRLVRAFCEPFTDHPKVHYLKEFEMKTKLNILIILALVIALAGGIASPAKAEGELYADAVYATLDDVQNPEAALGAPDGIYATFGPAGGTIVLEMVTPAQGSLTIYHSTTSPSCEVQAINLNSQSVLGGGYTIAGADHTSFIVMGDIEFVGVICPSFKKTTGFQLDAVYVGP